MSAGPDKILQFWQELKRRKVVRIITVYAAAAFVILELTSIIVDPLKLPEWTLPLIIVLLSIGFVIAVILSWVYDITPDGVQKTPTLDKQDQEQSHEKPKRILGWKIATYSSVVIIAGLIVLHLFDSGIPNNLRVLEKSVAVLPFENLGLKEESTALHDAIPIALSMELRNIEGFRVPSWRSTSRYKETNLQMPDIGEELEVNYIILGSVQEQEGKVRIDIEFIHAATGEVIWSESEEMVLNDIFQVQRDISAHVARALRGNFDTEHKDPTDNPDAWLAFLTGMRYYHTDETEVTFRQSMEHFHHAVQLDPGFIQAYVKLSTAHSWMYHMHYDRTPDRLTMAREAYEKARAMDPRHPEVKLALGVYYYVTYDYDKALEQYEMIGGEVVDEFELQVCLGSLYRRMRTFDKSIEHWRKAAETDPQSRIPRLNLGETSLLLRDYEMAEKYFNQYILMGGSLDDGLVTKTTLYLLWEEGTASARRALQEASSSVAEGFSPHLTHFGFQMDLIDTLYDDALNRLEREGFEKLDDQMIYRPKSLYLAILYGLQDDMDRARLYYDSARIHLETKIIEIPDDSRYHSSLGLAYAGLGMKQEAIREGELALSIMPLEKDYYRGIFILEDMARILTMVGEFDQALQVLRQLLSIPSAISVNLLKKDPAWKPLWELPAFQQLMENYQVN